MDGLSTSAIGATREHLSLIGHHRYAAAMREQVGLINIEASAEREPVVSTKEGGIPEIIRHTENGFLVECKDLAWLVNCTGLLIEGDAVRREMGQRASEIVEAQFTDLPVRKLKPAYEKLIR